VTGEVLDSHHHLWDTRAVDYELFRNHPQLAGCFGLPEYETEASAAGVTASICVEAASAGADGRLETEWLLRETTGDEFVKGIVAWAPLEDPRSLDDHLSWLRDMGREKVVGVRRSFERQAPDFPRRPDVAAGARIAGERGFVVDLVMFPDSLAATIDLVDACPETQFVLDHCGKPWIKERSREPWHSALRELSMRSNVVCKLSGLVTEADPASWTIDDLKTYVEDAFTAFGAARMLYGSDWPLTRLAGGHARWLATVGFFTEGFDAAEQAAVFSQNARRVYKLGQP
jgi:L-fuconolactonase